MQATKFFCFLTGFIFLLIVFQSCQTDNQEKLQPDSATNADTIPANDPVYKDTGRFSSEPGLLKMIRENYAADLKDSSCILVLTEVRGCNCGLLSFEEIDSAVTLFRQDKSINTFWLLKGKDPIMSDKIMSHHPADRLLPAPKRSFEEYGLFQSATCIFEIRSASEISRWQAIQR